MPPGRYFATASRPGFFVSRAGGQAGVRLPIACSDTCNPAEVDFELLRGAVLGGVVVDELGNGIQGVKVTAYREDKGLSGQTVLIESRIISSQSRQREDCFQKAVIKRGLRRMRRRDLRERSSSSQ